MSDTKEKTVAVGEANFDSDEIMSKYDKESSFRRLDGIPAKIVFLIAVGWSVFQLYTALFGTFPSTLQRAPHLGAALVLTYLLYPAYGKPTKKYLFMITYVHCWLLSVRPIMSLITTSC